MSANSKKDGRKTKPKAQSNASNMPTFVCLDTNMFVRYITQGKTGCEEEHWDNLVNHISSNSVTLLLPEVVELELKKQWELLPEKLKAKFKAGKIELEKGVKNEIEHSEMQDVMPALIKEYDRIEKEKLEAMERRHEAVQTLLMLPQIVKIPFDNEIWLAAKKRSLSGQLAKPESKSEADCILVESLLIWWTHKNKPSIQMLLCTENVSDFGLLIEDRSTVLHPRISRDLPQNKLLLNLKSLLEFLKTNQPVEKPTQDEVEEALKEEETRYVENLADTISKHQVLSKNALQLQNFTKCNPDLFKTTIGSALAEEALKAQHLTSLSSLANAMKDQGGLSGLASFVEKHNKNYHPLLWGTITQNTVAKSPTSTMESFLEAIQKSQDILDSTNQINKLVDNMPINKFNPKNLEPQ